jgi:ferrous iron transport protein B
LFSIYLIGIVLAVVTALIMKRIVFAKKEVPFVMELPPYRIPTLKNTSLHMWHKGQQYLKKMGNVILLASILIWALGYFPRHIDYTANYDTQIQNIKIGIISWLRSKTRENQTFGSK